MVESTEIAYTYIRSIGSKDKKIQKFFTENFVHLHVPAGATPQRVVLLRDYNGLCPLFSSHTGACYSQSCHDRRATLTGLLCLLEVLKKKLLQQEEQGLLG
ncbi:MAG: hypothetical protein CM1200mP28_14120 [Deltaproteobacteria bacterium]|nr:MAG: hypothetical protein CM1200mP28_14120 [Deltaproteobacteria bacterium]